MEVHLIMRILIVSDIHHEGKPHRGIDQSRAWEWLLNIVDIHKPDLLLSCGDWGIAISKPEFYELLKRVLVLSIYGNHENMDVLNCIYNIKSKEYLPVLMEDGKIYEFNNLRITGINGIIAEKKKIKKGVPRKTPSEFLEIAEKLKGKNIDILLLHEIPAIREIYPEIRVNIATITAEQTIRIIEPKIVFNGHLHWYCYNTYKYKNKDILYLRIDSSQRHKCYATMDVNNMKEFKIKVWEDLNIIEEIDLNQN